MLKQHPVNNDLLTSEDSTNMSAKRKTVPTPKVSYNYRPADMKLTEWQIILRRQAAAKAFFAISAMDERYAPGDYQVINPINKSEYKVVYRGQGNEWNYCSCMDFKASRLGTCKHIEAVALWIGQNKLPVYNQIPPYTSVYVSYKDEREVRLRVGTDNREEFLRLAEPYFTPDGRLKPEALHTVTDFFLDAFRLNNTFRLYPDALSFILEQRDNKRRRMMLSQLTDTYLDTILKTKLYPYQKEGIRFAFGAGKSIIADEMGLGKTIQAIGTAEILKKEKMISTALIVCPTSLKYQWKKEIERFTNSTAVVVEGNHLRRKELYQSEEFYKIVSYNSACNDIKAMRSLQTDLLIMDEVQRLKNWNTQISKAARRIDSEYAVILSGTPLENKLEELYSIMQFVDQYCLGPYYEFMDQTVVTADTGRVIGYKGLNEIGKKMAHVLIRRRKRDVALQLPERTDKILFVPMTGEQKAMHDDFQFVVSCIVTKWRNQRFLSEKDRKRLLMNMSQMRMVCDSSYILDQRTRYDTKVEETMNILQGVFESGDEKVVIFSQWERMTRLIAHELDKLGVRYEYLHGGVPSEKRKDMVQDFTELPESRVFISTDAGSTGLNLQVASVLINLDLPWNPAVLEQRIARIYRIGQKRNIQVINMVASGTIEERMLDTLNFKSSLFEGILDDGADSIFLEDSKFDKMMNTIETITQETEGEESTVIIGSDDTEEKNVVSSADELQGELDFPEDEQEELLFESAINRLEEPEKEAASSQPEESTENGSAASGPTSGATDTASPEQLVQQGMSFFAGLARTLSSPEATEKLVNSLVEEDKETGQTTLKIPVPDKESVTNILKLFGTLLGK